ncbi:MAG: DegV family protein, partial [Erysipelotrichaceae bacterium]|nr:DegV family protein [Erysipelotrichaceae bacterium]
EHMKEKPIDETWSITIAHTNAIADAELFYHQISEAFPTADIQITQVCNVVSAQAGLGCVCLQYFQKV